MTLRASIHDRDILTPNRLTPIVLPYLHVNIQRKPDESHGEQKHDMEKDTQLLKCNPTNILAVNTDTNLMTNCK